MAFRSATNTGWFTNSSGVTGQAVAIPSGAATNDIAVMVCFIERDLSVEDVACTGFTKLTSGNAYVQAVGTTGAHYLVVLWRRLLEADAKTGNWTVTWNVNDSSGEISAFLFSGRTTTGDPWDTGTGAWNWAGSAANVSTTPTVSLTPTVAGTDVLWSATTWDGFSGSLPSGFTNTFGNLTTIPIGGRKNDSAATATGSLTMATASAAASAAFVGALLPAAAAVAWNYHVIQG